MTHETYGRPTQSFVSIAKTFGKRNAKREGPLSVESCGCLLTTGVQHIETAPQVQPLYYVKTEMLHLNLRKRCGKIVHSEENHGDESVSYHQDGAKTILFSPLISA